MSSSLVAFETGRTLTHRVGSFDHLASLHRGSQNLEENQPRGVTQWAHAGSQRLRRGLYCALEASPV